jgi:hypothetical protein
MDGHTPVSSASKIILMSTAACFIRYVVLSFTINHSLACCFCARYTLAHFLLSIGGDAL